MKNSRYCPSQGLGRTPQEKDRQDRNLHPEKGLWILPKSGCQAPESEEETSSRVRVPPLTTANPDSDFAEEKGSSCSEGVIRGGRAQASPGTLPLRGLMLCNFSGLPRLLKTAEAQLIKYIFTGDNLTDDNENTLRDLFYDCLKLLGMNVSGANSGCIIRNSRSVSFLLLLPSL